MSAIGCSDSNQASKSERSLASCIRNLRATDVEPLHCSCMEHGFDVAKIHSDSRGPSAFFGTAAGKLDQDLARELVNLCAQTAPKLPQRCSLAAKPRLADRAEVFDVEGYQVWPTGILWDRINSACTPKFVEATKTGRLEDPTLGLAFA